VLVPGELQAASNNDDGTVRASSNRMRKGQQAIRPACE
jgi:hypothetical protein